MKRIPLTRGKFAIVDDCDFKWLSKWTWQADKIKHKRVPPTYYARSHPTYNGPKLHMHREIMARIGFNKALQVDHKDGNSLNNRRKNLRVASNSQNNANKLKLSGYSSRFKGVAWEKSRNRWSAELTCRCKKYHLGRFEIEEDAAKAYDTAARKHFKDFARLNFP